MATSTEKSPVTTLYLYQSGKTCQCPDKTFRKLLKELQAGRGQPEIVQLCENGYDEFLAWNGEAYCTSDISLEMLGY